MKLRTKMLSVAASVLAMAAGSLAGSAETDTNLFFFVADTHIREKDADGKPGDPGTAAKLTACVHKILAKKPYPSVVIFCGDLTDNGRPEQMARFRTLIQPLRDAGIKCQPMSGNHDYYAGRHAELFASELAASPVSGKVVSVVETPAVDIVCLDTADMETHDGSWGRINGAQLEWLKGYMKKNDGHKPYFICAHHPLRQVPIPVGVDLFHAATGWIGGHFHVWHDTAKNEWEVSVVYIPSTRDGRDPSCVAMRRVSGGFSFTLMSTDEKDPKNGQSFSVKDKAPSKNESAAADRKEFP